MIPVGWLAPSADCWDANMLRLLLDGDLYPHGLKVRHHVGYPNTDDPVVIVVPGRYYAQHTDQINEAIKRFVSVLMVVTSDEEATFDIGDIVHPRARFWVQTPRTARSYGDARLFGVGFPPHFNDLPQEPPAKDVDVFLAAQKTHVRRWDAFTMLENPPEGRVDVVEATEGFTQGLPPADYVRAMCSAKVAPAPSGAVSPDSFRLYEALEAHCLPVADDVSPVDGPTGYWRRIFNDPPFPIIENYRDLPGWIDDILAGWPANANRIAAWWIQTKRAMSKNLVEDLKCLGAVQ